MQRLPGYSEVIARIDGDPKHYTLAELNQFRQSICSKFLPPLSDCAMLYYKHQKDDFLVMWLLPSELARKLQIASSNPEGAEFLQKQRAHLSVKLDEDQDTIPDVPLEMHSVSSEIPLQGAYTQTEYFNYLTVHSNTPSSPSDLSPAQELYESEQSVEELSVGMVDDLQLTQKLRELQVELSVNSFSVVFGNRQKRDKRPKTDKGCYPSISINNHGTVVEVNHQMGTNWMFYRVGQVTDGAVVWGHSAAASAPRKMYYGSGAYPQVCLNDLNIVVEVHKGQYLDRCFCRIGKVDPHTKTIYWFSSKYFNVGINPAVAFNNKGTVLTVFQDNVFTKHFNYRVGRVNDRMEIAWCKNKEKVQSSGTAISVDMNNSDLVVLAYQTAISNHVHYKVGKVVDSSVKWTSIIHKGFGFTPSITINNRNHVILIHQSLGQRHLVSNVGVAKWDKNFKGIIWSEDMKECNKHYGKGLYPSISLNNSGQFVEVHEPRIAPNRNRLYYYIGDIKNPLLC